MEISIDNCSNATIISMLVTLTPLATETRVGAKFRMPFIPASHNWFATVWAADLGTAMIAIAIRRDRIIRRKADIGATTRPPMVLPTIRSSLSKMTVMGKPPCSNPPYPSNARPMLPTPTSAIDHRRLVPTTRRIACNSRKYRLSRWAVGRGIRRAFAGTSEF